MKNTELILFDRKVADKKELEELFSKIGGLKPILETIEELAKNFSYDLSAQKGKDIVASQAYAVSRTKTYLDKLRKEVTAESREKVKRVNDEWKTTETFLDKLRDEIRKPLTDLEEKEKIENEKKEQIIKNLEMVLVKYHPMSEVVALRESLKKLDEVKVEDGNWGEEFEYKVHKAKKEAIAHVQSCIDTRVKHDEDQAQIAKERAELNRLREEQQKRDEEDRKKEEERLEKENAEKAKAAIEKELKEKRDREIKEKEEREAIEKEQNQKAKELAERRAIEAEEKSKKLEEEKKVREANELLLKENAIKSERENKRIVHNIILKSLNDQGIDEETCKQIITLVGTNKIPNLKINYSLSLEQRNTISSTKEENKVEKNTSPSFKL